MFIVEAGTGAADTNAFRDVASVDAYQATRGNAQWAGDDAGNHNRQARL